MNHEERAYLLLDRYAKGQGSDQAAIAHALLAINETLQKAADEMNIEMPPLDQVAEGFIAANGAEKDLADLNQRIAEALACADRWAKVTESETDNRAESQAFQVCARQIRGVLR